MSAGIMAERLLNWALTSHVFEAWFGAFLLYAFLAQRSRTPFETLLLRLLPRTSEPKRVFLDIVISTVCGAFVGVAFLQPRNPGAAILSGWLWLASLNVFLRRR